MSEEVSGHATPEGTRAFASRVGPAGSHGFSRLGSTALTASRLGFGCYRVDDETADHRAALDLALSSGCNLIDTSTNYTDGASERLVGQVTRDRLARGLLMREELIVVSKIGYVQGRNMRLALERESAGRAFPEMVKYMEGCWHCIHPDFLSDQLVRSRARLGVRTLDVCLLHNPEYFLSDAKNRGGGDLEEIRTAFYRRLRDAFAFMEDAVRREEILAYGVSSNSAVVGPGDPEATSVERMLAAAREAGGAAHHFRVLQIPMNLYESGAALVRNTGPGSAHTPLEAAAGADLGVLLNRPLNAFAGNRLLRLAEPEVAPRGDSIDAIRVRFSRLERDFLATVAPHIGDPTADWPGHLFRLVEEIAGATDEIQDFIHWQQIERQYVTPRVHHMAGEIARRLDPEKGPAAWRAFWKEYRQALRDLLAAVGRRAAEKGSAGLRAIAAAIDPSLPTDRRGEPLSRKALWVLASTPGVSTVLVGMRRPSYVRDATAVLSWPPLPDPLPVYEKLREDA
jgi:aryl-alcohol dehydrogenase-like predicted oxidoreductase